MRANRRTSLLRPWAAVFLPALVFSCGSSTGTEEPPPPVISPPASAGHALVYHAALRAVVLVNAGLGGMSSPPLTSRTVLWRWNGQSWSILDSLGPPVRNLGGVAYDIHRDRIVMHGGSYSVDLIYDETWEWSATNGWENRTSGTGPGRRDHTDMVYDPERRRTVLFGGSSAPGVNVPGTWLWDGNSWQQSPATGPVERTHHSLVFDAASRRVLVFGGRSSTTTLGDTWAWNGTAWEQAAAATTPRSHARLGATSAGVILVGGGQGETGAQLNGGAWSAMPGSGPGPRYLPGVAYDADRQVTVLFGGGNPATDGLLSDTWEYSPSSGWRRISP